LKKNISPLGPNSGTTTKPDEESFAGFLVSIGRHTPEGGNPGAYVFLDFDNDPSEKLPKHEGRAPAVLIRQEPSVVRPQNFRPDYLKHMSMVIDVGRSPLVSNSRINWPQRWTLEHLEFPKIAGPERIDRFVIINANKMSFVEGELYSLRRLAAQKSSDIDVWGFDWDMAWFRRATKAFEELLIPLKHGFGIKRLALKGWFKKPLSFKGTSKDKLSTLASYKYSLVIENSSEYMSEKLFDSLFAGTFPIYVGPNPVDFGMPEFVAIHSSPDLESVMKAINRARTIDIDTWRASVLTWLKSDGLEQAWSGPFVTQQIIDKIDLLVSNSKPE
jgi:hypothetical protein